MAKKVSLTPGQARASLESLNVLLGQKWGASFRAYLEVCKLALALDASYRKTDGERIEAIEKMYCLRGNDGAPILEDGKFKIAPEKQKEFDEFIADFQKREIAFECRPVSVETVERACPNLHPQVLAPLDWLLT